MRVTILNGDPNPSSSFQKYVSDVSEGLTGLGHKVVMVDLRNLDIKGCSACFGCWVKTPGECVKSDESSLVCRAAINSDLLLLASPLLMGFTSALLKRTVDQMIPLLHPYFVIDAGEVHHLNRYPAYPKLGLILGMDANSDAEDVDITTTIWTRFARNFKSHMVYTAVSNRTIEEAVHGFAAAA
jgi:multimeric flavodoxin WrbA